MAKHRSPKQWASVIAAYHNRSVSQAQFCSKHQISASALNYHLRKASQPPCSRQGDPPPQKLPPLVELVAELPPGDTPAAEAGEPDVEVTWTTDRLGMVTVRCHCRHLGEVFSQINKSTQIKRVS